MPFMVVTVLTDNGAFRNAFCDFYTLQARSCGAVAAGACSRTLRTRTPPNVLHLTFERRAARVQGNTVCVQVWLPMSSCGRRNFNKAFPGDDGLAEAAKENPLAVAGLRSQGRLSFFRSLPRACIGFLFAVFCDVFVMVAYGCVLLVTGLGASSFYFASLILSASAMLMYFSISAIRSENTVELLAAVGISSCVNATVFYFRANENAFAAVQAREHACRHVVTT